MITTQNANISFKFLKLFLGLSLLVNSLTILGSAMPLDKFADLIDKIDQEQPDPLGAYDLGQSATFCKLYSNPQKYISDAMQYLANNKTSNAQINIVIHIMHKLPEKEFIEYSTELFELHKQRKIPAALLDYGVMPIFELNSVFIRHYQDPTVQRILLSISNSPVFDKQSRANAKEVLTGKTYANYLNHESDAKMSCKGIDYAKKEK